jgi:hypothetical protein
VSTDTLSELWLVLTSLVSPQNPVMSDSFGVSEMFSRKSFIEQDDFICKAKVEFVSLWHAKWISASITSFGKMDQELKPLPCAVSSGIPMSAEMFALYLGS